MSKHFQLTKDELDLLLRYDPESGLFTWKTNVAKNVKAGTVAGGRHPDGYILVTIRKRHYLAHRLAWFMSYGEWPEQPVAEIDHINRDKSDNRLSNLRLVSRAENMQNRPVSPRSKSGLKGVIPYYHDKSRWIAVIRYGGKQRSLGIFDTKESAYEAYVNAARAHHSCSFV